MVKNDTGRPRKYKDGPMELLVLRMPRKCVEIAKHISHDVIRNCIVKLFCEFGYEPGIKPGKISVKNCLNCRSFHNSREEHPCCECYEMSEWMFVKKGDIIEDD